MKPQELGAALKGIAESHATKRSFGDSIKAPTRELNFSHTGGMIGLDSEGERTITLLTEQLLNDRPKIADMCSSETVRHELVEAIKRFVYSETPLDPSREAERLLGRLSGKPCDFVCVFPAKGGKLSATMRVNRTTLVPSIEQIPEVLTNAFPDLINVPVQDLVPLIRDNKPPTPAPNLIRVSSIEPDWYAVSRSLALDEKVGVAKALQSVEEDIGLLRLKILETNQHSEDAPSVEVLSGPVLVFKNGMALGAFMDTLPSQSFMLPTGLYEIQHNLDIEVAGAYAHSKGIAGILNAEKKTELQERVYLAFTWLNKALKQRDSRERLLDSIIGMEALMLQRHDSRGHALAERVAFCLGDDLTSRLKTFGRVRELVRMRNLVSHEGEMDVLKEQANSAVDILREIVQVMTERSEREANIDAFISEIEVLKFS